MGLESWRTTVNVIVQVFGLARGDEEIEYWRMCSGRRLERKIWKGRLMPGWRVMRSKREVCADTSSANFLSSVRRVSSLARVSASLVNCLSSLTFDLLTGWESSKKPLRRSWMPRGIFEGREPNALVFRVMVASLGRLQWFMMRRTRSSGFNGCPHS